MTISFKEYGVSSIIMLCKVITFFIRKQNNLKTRMN